MRSILFKIAVLLHRLFPNAKKKGDGAIYAVEQYYSALKKDLRQYSKNDLIKQIAILSHRNDELESKK